MRRQAAVRVRAPARRDARPRAPRAGAAPRPRLPARPHPGLSVTAGGTVAPGFEPVRDAFRALGDDAAFAAYVDGELVADLWSGSVGRDSLVHLFSVSKTVAALCALMVAEPDDPAPLPRGATVRQVLAHQAGLLALREPQPLEALLDWERTIALLEAEPLWWEPGAAHGEHALFYGHLAGAIVRERDGRPLGRFVREELRTDIHCGLRPWEQGRVVPMTDPGGLWPEGALTSDVKRLAMDNPPALLHLDVVNSAAWRAAEIPGVNMHGTARAVAALFARLPARMAEPQMTAPDVLLERESTWGLGVGIEPGVGYGMGGVGGSLAWVDPGRGVAYAYL
ncbi:MAG TPA: serine hydrolase domain-containing protein, partial [Solirubrobacteraceae bacterium]|nr:serine hydrolase domain-containing protein [Solirubrobacteraceae bacterium]